MSFNMSFRTICPSGRFVHQDETSACYQNDQDDLSQDEMSQDETSQDDLSVRTKRLLATYYTLQILTEIDDASEHGAWHIRNITK